VVAREHHPLSADQRGALPRGGARRRLLLGIAAAYLAAWAIGIGFGYGLKGTRSWENGAHWELDVLRAFHQDMPGWYDAAMRGSVYLGTNLVILPAMLALGLWLWRVRHSPLTAVHLLVVCVGALSMNGSMKYLLSRDRPSLFQLRGLYAWASYPSGHLILTTSLYFTAALMLRRARGWRWPFALAAFGVLLTGFSRLYLSVHWPTDLIGGVLIGLVWLTGTWKAFTSFDARRRARRAAV
jgi:membrane-associated phospholipid phosphatase